MTRQKCNKHEERSRRDLFKELPYFNHRGTLLSCHGRFNNLLPSDIHSKRYLDKLTSLYDLDLFKLNASCSEDLNADSFLYNHRISSRYYTPHSFKEWNNNFVNNDAYLSIFHNNLISLDKNLERLQCEILEELDFHFDIVGITETKIHTSSSADFETSMPGYKFEHTPTPLSFGGVGMFINESLDFTVIEKTSNEAFQALWIELNFTSKKNVICGIIYRQHNSPDSFLSYFDQTLEKYIATGKNICIMGDFNLCLLKSETSEICHNFLLSLQSCYLIPTIHKPTRVRANSASLIDNILVNIPDHVAVSGNIISDTSDHFSQFCILRSSRDNIKPVQKKIRDFTRFNETSFLEDLTLINWNSIAEKENEDIDKIFSTFYNSYNKIVNKHAPLKQISHRQLRRFSKPWITRGIRTSIKIKNKLFASGNRQKYKLYRNKINKLVKASKKQYYHNYFSINFTNMKKTWDGINSLLNRKSKPQGHIKAIKNPHNDNKIVRNPQKIANIFNDYFASVGRNLANKIPNSCQYSYFLDNSKSPDKSFLFKPVFATEIELEILSIPNNKSHGLYSSPTKLLKISSKIISEILAKIINISITSGRYPSKLKMSKIIPVYKQGDATELNNYRPISLLSTFDRVFEKLMYKRMKDFIDLNNIISTGQYGFREGHSTEHAITDIVSTIQKNMDKHFYTCGIFIDLKKAFDTVDLKILLDKLRFYGFRGIINDWFESFLCSRSQTTQIENHISNKSTVTHGVPQGSVLGPLLLYINDIQNASKIFHFYLFADDTSIL